MKEACVEIILGLKSPNTIHHAAVNNLIQNVQDEVLVKAFIFFDRIKSCYVGQVTDIADNTRYIFFAALMVASYVSNPSLQEPRRGWNEMFEHFFSQTQTMPGLTFALQLFQDIGGVKPLVINKEEYNAKVQYIQHEFITDKLFGKKIIFVPHWPNLPIYFFICRFVFTIDSLPTTLLGTRVASRSYSKFGNHLPNSVNHSSLS
jgi:hypothetical protein